MLSLKLKEIVEAVDGKILQGNPDQIVNNMTIDSRRVKPGDLFFAIIGENNDGHNFIPEAVDNGARVVITSRSIKPYSGLAIILVRDTTQALQDLASFVRKKIENLKVIGITGSAGKTTTKDIIASILGEEKRVLKSKGNYNNEYGLPLSLLELDGNEDIAILEMAMRNRGDISRLAEIASPDVGVITNIGPAHLENLKTIENIASAKAELLAGLNSDGIAVLNYDDEYIREMVNSYGDLEKITVSLKNKDVDYYADQIEYIKNGEESRFRVHEGDNNYILEMDRAGEHNIYNALAAIAVARAMGISWDSIKNGIKDIEVTELRQEIRKIDGIRIINDSYNANPLSMKAGIDSLLNIEGKRKIAVLGAMLELGRIENAAHKEIGKYLYKNGIDVLIGVGSMGEIIAEGAVEAGMAEQNIYVYDNNEDAASFINKIMRSGDAILVKGSRALEMEEIVDLLLEYGG
ncbi:UDP-N-acetylmuramoyl-tripeptide--D-alanyl-D-alanine ligase [Halanaerobiaceae bacterium Z-7014]|uniref:UDP-N-acetylmuramoyl-tripeptide--D-alanyl-D-alanine ligase n=1 Tax=Halonatronomonas betaini TaxID=2778430 RepID=A0A931AX30_9FIRM|nr:UDP-N-acetylmuramoyl-tripeptide--D-alanyl-D-alanine ligase [Halonatronomonas betaini]MBF8437641.1 UDP-N-acetylmuramoyl-tripeptide--D-alanyl-D-alanine ligase [Halonatronomonas betaini]